MHLNKTSLIKTDPDSGSENIGAEPYPYPWARATEYLQEGDEDGEEGGEGQSITRDEELIKVSTQIDPAQAQNLH